VSAETPDRQDGPTELVEGADGELIERLSGGTATLLLIWLIGVGGLSTLVAAWLFVWMITGERFGPDELFGGFGFYTGLGGAAGPCVLWLAGRAQGHSLGWFLLTSAKIALVMVAVVAALIAGAVLLMAAAIPGAGALPYAALMVGLALVLSQLWGAATWAADRWIARARVTTEP
jgi:hypothetical protein